MVINEIMANPDSSAEWIELHNPDPVPANLCRFSMCDAGECTVIDTACGISIPSYGYVLLAQDSALLRSRYPWVGGRIIVPSHWPTLNNDGDNIVLKDSANRTVDSVAYASVAWFGESLRKGISIERANPLAASNASANWAFSNNSNGATPGFKNSAETALPASFSVRAGPKLFRPAEGEAFIIYAELPSAGALTIEVYNVPGQKIRTVFSGEANGPVSFRWNGRTDNNTPVRTGPYILFVQYKGNGQEQRHKQTLVVAPKR